MVFHPSDLKRLVRSEGYFCEHVLTFILSLSLLLSFRLAKCARNLQEHLFLQLLRRWHAKEQLRYGPVMHNHNLWCTWKLSFLRGPIVLQRVMNLGNLCYPILTKLVAYFDRGSSLWYESEEWCWESAPRNAKCRAWFHATHCIKNQAA